MKKNNNYQKLIETGIEETGVKVTILDKDSTSPEATLLRLIDIPSETNSGEVEDLPPERRYNWFRVNLDREVSKRQEKYVRRNPHSHMKLLIDFINDYLDTHNLADTRKNVEKARAQFFLNIKR